MVLNPLCYLYLWLLSLVGEDVHVLVVVPRPGGDQGDDGGGDKGHCEATTMQCNNAHEDTPPPGLVLHLHLLDQLGSNLGVIMTISFILKIIILSS